MAAKTPVRVSRTMVIAAMVCATTRPVLVPRRVPGLLRDGVCTDSEPIAGPIGCGIVCSMESANAAAPGRERPRRIAQDDGAACAARMRSRTI
jgi:hypothetical protein